MKAEKTEIGPILIPVVHLAEAHTAKKTQTLIRIRYRLHLPYSRIQIYHSMAAYNPFTADSGHFETSFAVAPVQAIHSLLIMQPTKNIGCLHGKFDTDSRRVGRCNFLQGIQ